MPNVNYTLAFKCTEKKVNVTNKKSVNPVQNETTYSDFLSPFRSVFVRAWTRGRTGSKKRHPEQGEGRGVGHATVQRGKERTGEIICIALFGNIRI